jgi:hypothetical protein
MNCLSEDRLVKAELGELPLNDMAGIDGHVSDCVRCARMRDDVQKLLRDLALGPPPETADSFIDRVMSARPTVESTAEEPRRPWRLSWSLRIPVLAAAALALTIAGIGRFVSLRHDRDGTWTARGQRSHARASPASASSEVLVMRGGHLLPVAGRTLAPDDLFAVHYANPGKDTRYLLAFAVDAAQVVHWIYPEYTDEATDPQSFPLPVSEETRLLPQLVEPEAPAEGPMQVVALTSQRPVRVKEVEQALRDAPIGTSPGRVLARIFPDDLVREWSCTWNVR